MKKMFYFSLRRLKLLSPIDLARYHKQIYLTLCVKVDSFIHHGYMVTRLRIHIQGSKKFGGSVTETRLRMIFSTDVSSGLIAIGKNCSAKTSYSQYFCSVLKPGSPISMIKNVLMPSKRKLMKKCYEYRGW